MSQIKRQFSDILIQWSDEAYEEARQNEADLFELTRKVEAELAEAEALFRLSQEAQNDTQ